MTKMTMLITTIAATRKKKSNNHARTRNKGPAMRKRISIPSANSMVCKVSSFRSTSLILSPVLIHCSLLTMEIYQLFPAYNSEIRSPFYIYRLYSTRAAQSESCAHAASTSGAPCRTLCLPCPPWAREGYPCHRPMPPQRVCLHFSGTLQGSSAQNNLDSSRVASLARKNCNRDGNMVSELHHTARGLCRTLRWRNS